MFWDAFLICLCPRVISEIIEIKSICLNISEDILKTNVTFPDCMSGLVISGESPESVEPSFSHFYTILT
jgi:hypothetical protein